MLDAITVVDSSDAVYAGSAIPVPEHEIVWTTEPFGEERRMLNGVGARTIPLDLLLSGKQMTREVPDEAAKDRADVEALAAARRT